MLPSVQRRPALPLHPPHPAQAQGLILAHVPILTLTFPCPSPGPQPCRRQQLSPHRPRPCPRNVCVGKGRASLVIGPSRCHHPPSHFHLVISPLGSVPVFSGELQVLGKKSSVTSVILENVHLYRLTPVGAFFPLLVEVCPAWGTFLTVTAPCLSGSLLRVPPFPAGVSSQETLSPPVTDTVLIQTTTC